MTPLVAHTSAPSRRLRRPRRLTASATVGVLLIAGLATLAPPTAPAATAAPLPAEAETFQVSRANDGTARTPFMTSDAQHVVFTSDASDVVTGDANAVADVFLKTAAQGSSDPFSGSAVLVSAPDGQVGALRANGASDQAVSSTDGRYVAFTSSATNLVGLPSAGDGRTYVYVRDTVKNRTLRIQGTAEPDASSYLPDLSDDGRLLVLTSDAANLDGTGTDVNGAPDSFIVDLDSNADGTFGDLRIERVLPAESVAEGTHDAVISGNGRTVAFLTPTQDYSGGQYVTDLDSLQYITLTFDTTFVQAQAAVSVSSGVTGRPSIDATGRVFSYIRRGACALDVDSVVATIPAFGGRFSVALGPLPAEGGAQGVDGQPSISADGSIVAWTTTVPGDAGDPAGPLGEPIVRVQPVEWGAAFDTGSMNVPCPGEQVAGWTDVAPGSHASLSASGRTVTFQSSGPSRIVAVDRHSSDGLTIASTQGGLVAPSFVTQVPTASISTASLRGYAAALADSPIHRIPIHRIPIHRIPIHRIPIHRILLEDSPIHRIPIHRIPIHRIPIHRIDLPGGWAQVLEGTPFAGELIQTVTLAEVLEWAEANPDTDAGRRILSLTLDDVDIDDTGLDALSLAAYALGDAPVAALPIPGTGTNLERWQGLAKAQGLGIAVDDETVLADLDAAGLDIASTGVEQLDLAGLDESVLDETLLGLLWIDPALLPGTPLGAIDVGALPAATRQALFGRTDVNGTLSAPAQPLLESADFATLAEGAPQLLFGDVLFSLLDRESYPWEQIAATSIDPRVASMGSPMECVGGVRCANQASFLYVFDVGPGEPTTFAAPTATLALPSTTRFDSLGAVGSGPGVIWTGSSDGLPPADGSTVSVPLADTRAGTVFELDATFSLAMTLSDIAATGTLVSGGQSAEKRLTGGRGLAKWDDPNHNWDAVAAGFPTILQPGTIYYEWISPAWLGTDAAGQPTQGPADDEDFYAVAPPKPGERLVISTNAGDGQISLSLYAPQGSDTSAATLGLANAGPVPGTPVTEQTSTESRSGADAGTQLPGQTLIDQVVQQGTGAASIEAASTDVSTAAPLLVRVASGDGRPSSSMYSLRVQYLPEPVETSCTPWAPAFAPDPASIAFSDAVTDETNTIYLVDTQRYDATFGVGATDAVRAGLAGLTGSGRVGDGTVQGAVLSIDDDERVRAARANLDQDPCSMEARKALVAAINTYVSAEVGDHRDAIRSVVLVGGDDIIPFAPVAQHTSQFTEQSHATELRLTQLADGTACPDEVAAGAVDPCATPLSAAAAASMILTDDPYGLAHAYESLGGFLYVPTTALGRLVETPDEIVASAERFAEADGVLAADSTATAGYGAWSELPDEVTSALTWRSAANDELGADDPDGLWNLDDVTRALFPDDGESPRVVSINAHADERSMLPGIADAEDGRFADADLFTAADVTAADDLAGSLVFLIGCHAGNNLPSGYYGADARDWVDVFSHAGGYVGNTGYGLANNVTTALSERLLALYASWIGVEVDGRKVSASEALTYAKQSYLGGLGLYSGYDEKALMETVYYGLPMYTFADAATTVRSPLPQIPEALKPLQTSAGGLSSAALTLDPTFEKRTVQDGSGTDVSYLTADGQAPAVVPGQPVLPKLVAQLRAEEGLTPRGVLITGLASQIDAGETAAIAEASVGVPPSGANTTDAAFPSSFATITSQQTPEGRADFLVLTPGRVQAPQGGAVGTASLERFTHLDLDVVYAPTGTADTTPPTISSVETRDGAFRFTADGTGSDIARAVLLIQYEGEDTWQPVSVSFSGRSGTATLPSDDRAFRWMLQVADASGNVATDTNRGRMPVFHAEPPVLAAPDDEPVTLGVGESLRRSVTVEGVQPGDELTARVAVAAGGAQVDSSPATVVLGDDGVTRAQIVQPFTTPGEYTVTLTVCRGTACASTDVAVRVPAPNTPPTSTVTLTSDRGPVRPNSVLTAKAVGADPDGDDVTFTYAWMRNGALIPDQTGWTLRLREVYTEPGDVIRVVATPSDALASGHASSAELALAIPPSLPQIIVTARNAAGVYTDGTWSRTPVTVEFTCSGIAGLMCSRPRKVSADTTAKGVLVTGTVRDLLGRTASASIRVLIDRTAPVLAPTVTPTTVPRGATATATPHARDAASGIAAQSCDTPATSVPGRFTVMCRATDNAGNTATAAAVYTVERPGAKTCRGVPDRTALHPINADGSSVFMRSSGIPITFSACDTHGKPIGTKSFVKKVSLVSTEPLPKKARINEVWYFPIKGFAYVKRSGLWIGELSTAGLARGKKYTYKVLLADGTSFTFSFGVK